MATKRKNKPSRKPFGKSIEMEEVNLTPLPPAPLDEILNRLEGDFNHALDAARERIESIKNLMA